MLSPGNRAGRILTLIEQKSEWQGTRHAIEVKLRRDTESEADGYEQVLRYLDQSNLDQGWLVLFDLRSTAPWSERLFIKTVEVGGKRLRVVGA